MQETDKNTSPLFFRVYSSLRGKSEKRVDTIGGEAAGAAPTFSGAPPVLDGRGVGGYIYTTDIHHHPPRGRGQWHHPAPRQGHPPPGGTPGHPSPPDPEATQALHQSQQAPHTTPPHRAYPSTQGLPGSTQEPPDNPGTPGSHPLSSLSRCPCQPAPSILPYTCPRSTPTPRSRQRARGDTQERRPAAVDQGPQEAHASHFPLLSCYLCCLPLSPPYTPRSNRRTPYSTRSARLHRQARTYRDPLGRHETPHLPREHQRETRRQATGMR